MNRLFSDDIPHIIWLMVFILPIVLSPSILTVWWACHFWLPREFYDQWHGWPLGRGKVLDIIGWEFGAVCITMVYISIS